MAPTAVAFDTLIKSQAGVVLASDESRLEHVSAVVRRVGEFMNAGRGGSGHYVATDEPAQFGGSGTAVDPAELLLVAVGASLSVTMTVHAALADVPIDAIDVSLAGSLDADRFFKPTAQKGGGFFDVRVNVSVETRATPAMARAVLDTALLASPVLRSIAAAPDVRLTVNGAAA